MISVQMVVEEQGSSGSGVVVGCGGIVGVIVVTCAFAIANVTTARTGSVLSIMVKK